MSKRKKITLILAAAALIIIVASCIAKAAFPPSGKVVYKYDYAGIEFKDELTEEEAAAVFKIIYGKPKYFMLLGSPSCGWDWDIAIIINGTRYMLALDTCGTVFIGGKLIPGSSLSYIDISNEEQDVLEKIFTSRGGVFPAI